MFAKTSSLFSLIRYSFVRESNILCFAKMTSLTSQNHCSVTRKSIFSASTNHAYRGSPFSLLIRSKCVFRA